MTGFEAYTTVCVESNRLVQPESAWLPQRRRRLSQGWQRLQRDARSVVACLTLAMLTVCGHTAWAAAAAPGSAPVALRVVGGFANLNQYTRHEQPFWTQQLPRRVPGQVAVEIVPFDQAGLTATDLFRAVQTGAVTVGTVLLSGASSLEPQLAGPDLAALNPDFASAQRTLKAYRPIISRLLQERHGLHLLAVYAYPAQVTYCSKPFAGLADLQARRVRVASAAQASFLAGLGAQPVQLPLSQVVSAMKAGSLDCAVTGTMTGNTLGLHEVTSHIHDLPLSWGLSAVVANGERWRALPAQVRSAIEVGLPAVESAIWAESRRETEDGLACNAGSAACKHGRAGSMTRVVATAADRKLSAERLVSHVVPAWTQRCSDCASLWRDTLAPAAGVQTR